MGYRKCLTVPAESSPSLAALECHFSWRLRASPPHPGAVGSSVTVMLEMAKRCALSEQIESEAGHDDEHATACGTVA
jgi:hypothetical protein